MPENNSQTIQINREQRNISKYAGLFFARLTLLVCLFFLLPFLLPNSFYVFVYIGAFPWILVNFFLSKCNSSEIILKSFAKKYAFTQTKLIAEKYTGNLTILFLVTWQLFINPDAITFESLQLAPGFLLLIYLLTRIIVTAVVKRKIHNYYTELIILD